MKNNIIFCILLLLMFSRCSEPGSNNKIIELNNTDNTLIKQKEELLSINQICPVHMNIIDTLFLFRTRSNCDDQYFHIYKYPEFKHIISFGEQGNGPNEFFEGELTYSCENVLVDNTLWFQDMNHKKFKKVDISKGHVKNTLLFPKEIGMPENISFVEERLLVGNCISKYMGSFFLYDLKTNEIKENYNVPEIRPEVKKEKKLMLYKNTLKVNNNCSKIVVAYEFFGQIDIFNLNLEKVLTIKIKNKKSEVNWNKGEIYEVPNDAWHYFSDLQLTDNYIFALYNNYQMNLEKEKLAKSILLKFNWEGELLNKYILPDRIDKFVVDNEQLKVIAIQYSNENHPFLIYDINSI